MKARPFDSGAAVHTLPPCNPSITLSLPSFSTASAISVAVNNNAWVPVILRKKRNKSKKRDLLLTFFTGERGQQGLRCGCGRAPDLFSLECNWEEEYEDQDFVVVNFYHFVFINDPEEEVAKHLSFLQALCNKLGQDSRHIRPSFKVLDIRGRIYVSQQGFNAQFSGPLKDALAYVKWLREDPRFAGVLFQVSPALSGHAFPRLKLLHKLSLVQLEGGSSHLPLTDPLMRATPLTPFQWKRRLEAVNKIDGLSSWNSSGSLILLDVRNGYEWDIGHFHGAQRPDVDCFRSTSFGLSLSEVNGSDPLACIDKEKTDILMYCTGGIRCDIYSTILRGHEFYNYERLEWNQMVSAHDISVSYLGSKEPMFVIAGISVETTKSYHWMPEYNLAVSLTICTLCFRPFTSWPTNLMGHWYYVRKRGFKNLFTLKGGVSHYLASEGAVEWVGNLFVFDSRLSLPPSAYKPQVMTETSWAQESSENSSFARCYICGSQVSELRHRNCANLDCNLLFLCCSSCVNDLKGCCCLTCINSTRRRPVLPGHQRYEKWHNYRDLHLKSI